MEGIYTLFLSSDRGKLYFFICKIGNKFLALLHILNKSRCVHELHSKVNLIAQIYLCTNSDVGWEVPHSTPQLSRVKKIQMEFE